MAAVTSPTAIKQERSMATFLAVRGLLAVGATDGVVQLAKAIIGG